MNVVNNSRIYVSGLKPCVTADELKDEFAKFGDVSSIELIVPKEHDKKKSRKKSSRQPFAYVTFSSESVADGVISRHEEWKNHLGPQEEIITPPLYSIVKLAKPISVIPCFAKRLKKSVDDHEAITNLVLQTNPRPNLVLLVHSSHLDRTVKLIFDLEKEKSKFPFESPCYVGSWSSKTKNTSFIFLSTCKEDAISGDGANVSRMYWYDYFMSNPILVRFAIRKLYAVDQVVRIPPSEQHSEQRTKRLVDAALALIGKTNEDDLGDNIILKVKAYPPKQNEFQKRIVSELYQRKEQIESDDAWQRKFAMDSIDHTHILSFLQLFNPQSYAKNMRATDIQTLDEIFMIGISRIPRHEIDNFPSYATMDGDVADDEDICRAYFKLKEAMDYYRRDTQNDPISFVGKVAFDCGSSPGGWTKYLLEDENCDLVYSCDPGKLDPCVESLPGTRYLKMRGKDGIEQVRKEGNIVHLWVSDMCLVDPKDQVHHLLMAKERGILSDDATFVLTLKFNTGHCKETFDRYAQEELSYLKESLNVANVKLYHLFSNRKGERTLIGQLQ
jgi:Predicted rRNA methylase